jgi:hypothetical protein
MVKEIDRSQKTDKPMGKERISAMVTQVTVIPKKAYDHVNLPLSIQGALW